jgi:transposase
VSEQEIQQRVAELYSGGKSIVEVAQTLGVTYGRVRRLLRASSIELRDPSQRLVGRTRPDKKETE